MSTDNYITNFILRELYTSSFSYLLKKTNNYGIYVIRIKMFHENKYMIKILISSKTLWEALKTPKLSEPIVKICISRGALWISTENTSYGIHGIEVLNQAHIDTDITQYSNQWGKLKKIIQMLTEQPICLEFDEDNVTISEFVL